MAVVLHQLYPLLYRRPLLCLRAAESCAVRLDRQLVLPGSCFLLGIPQMTPVLCDLLFLSSMQEDRLPAVESCVVCLEKPTVGSSLRALPCAHTFHAEVSL